LTHLAAAISLTPAMNMFRDLLCLLFLAFGFGLIFTDPNNWSWAQRAGPGVTSFLHVCGDFKPFIIVACFIITVALFMTRKKY
jgi:hypothetical protein